MNQLNRRNLVSLLCASGAGLVAPGIAAAKEVVELTIGYPPQVDFVPYWIADDKGYFAAEGLQVKWLPTPIPAIVPAVLKKSVDIGLLNTVQAIQPISAGLPLSLVSGAYTLPPVGNLGLARRVGAKIDKPADLVGKRLGVASYSSIMLYMFNYWYDQQGLNFKDLKWIEADGPTQLEMFKRGELDACLAYDPWFSVMKEQGVAEDFINFYADTPRGTMVTGALASVQWTKGKPQVMAAFRRAVAKGVKLANEDKPLGKETLQRWAKLSDNVAKRLEIPSYTAEIQPVHLEHVLKVMRHQSLLKKPLQFADVVTPWRV